MRDSTLRSLAIASGLVALAVTVRLLVHQGTLPPNFSAVGAAALFAGAFLPLRWAIAVPLAAMLIADRFIGGYEWPVMLTVYALLAAPALLGRFVIARSRAAGVTRAALITGSAIGSSLVFFLGTNFVHWAVTGQYPISLSGLTANYLAALPFLKYTLAGDLVFTSALFGAAALLRRAAPHPHFQTSRV